MIHLPSAEIRAEMLRSLSLIRVTEAEGDSGKEPSLIIKCSSLCIKYILQKAKICIHVNLIQGNTICYSIQIWDDDEFPVSFWSVAKSKEEIYHLQSLSSGGKIAAFLFNEVCVNVASAYISAESVGARVKNDLDKGIPSAKPEEAFLSLTNQTLEETFKNTDYNINIFTINEWTINNSTLITNGLESSEINFFGTDEGDQQQELIRWLVDELHPQGADLSPQIHEPSGNKEFTDVMLSHEFGSILIESKTLSVFNRESLPDRSRLTRNITKHIDDAVNRQLRVACRQLKSGVKIYNKKSGLELNVERNAIPHAICLIPDLSLIHGMKKYGGEMLRNFYNKNRSFLHILDTNRLFRVMQAAHMISSKSKSITPLMAFDAHLMDRFDFAAKRDEPNFDMRLDLNSQPHRLSFSC